MEVEKEECEEMGWWKKKRKDNGAGVGNVTKGGSSSDAGNN